MIRKFRREDISRVMEIWLDSNISAHSFIPAKYWQDNYDTVKEMLPQAEIYVCETENKIQGFVGLNDDYLEGIFISGEAQSKGNGKKLLDYLKTKKNRLTLNVYQKNQRAVRFYERENFKICSENMDDNTGEKDCFMIWHKEDN